MTSLRLCNCLDFSCGSPDLPTCEIGICFGGGTCTDVGGGTCGCVP